MATLMKKIINELVETVEDIATAVIGTVLLVFTVGAWYGSIFANQPQLWYPLYMFIVLLVLKLIKDLMVRVGRKKEKE